MSSTDDSPLDPVARAASGIAHETAEKLKDVADDVAATVGDVASRVVHSAPEVSSYVQDSVNESAGFMRRQLRERPTVVLAATALVAFVGGCVLGRRSML